jgi:hypothetical protein
VSQSSSESTPEFESESELESELESEKVAFPELRYDRVCRTPYSEAFLLSEGDDPLGRVDVHYGSSVVHAVLVVERDLADADVRALAQRIDDDLIWTSDQPREDFLVTVYRGNEAAVLSDQPPEEEA